MKASEGNYTRCGTYIIAQLMFVGPMPKEPVYNKYAHLTVEQRYRSIGLRKPNSSKPTS